jgi:methionyl aminopeptidase
VNILLLGPQGSGKGTQAKRIAAGYELPHIATGDMLREAMAAETPLGRRVKPIVDRGELVPDALMIELIRDRLGEEDAQNGFVVDGFPRTMAQAEALDAMLREIGRDLDLVFELQIDDETAVARMLKRAEEEGRIDDTPEVIRRRLQTYHAETAPLVEHYRVRGLVVGIHADRSIGEVFGEIQTAIEQLAGRASGLSGRESGLSAKRTSGGVWGNREVPPASARQYEAMIIRKSKRELEQMADAGAIVVRTIELVGEHVRPGVSTAELDAIADEFIRSVGGVPTFKGYRGYPAATCISPNEMVVHGIPGRYVLRDGDIVSFDVGVTLEGFVADSAFTFAVGEISEEAQRLLDACQAALAAGIEQSRPGNRVGDISSAVQRATEEAGFSVVRSLVGHGVGRSMHEEPQIPNFGLPGRGPLLQEGMTLAIEPMINAGDPEIVLAEDEWSISTADGSLSAHFEHTVAITVDGPRILTAVEAGLLQ